MSDSFRVLAVCTGNICRSPAVTSLVRRAWSMPEASVEVSSAGTHAVVGSRMHPLTLMALAEQGLNEPWHVARQLEPGLVERADLVLTAARSHRVAVVQVDPTAVRRTFTLAEFSRLAPLALQEAPDGGPESWRRLVQRAASLRGAAVPVNPADDDLADPVTGGPDDHRRMVRRVLGLVDVISRPAPA